MLHEWASVEFCPVGPTKRDHLSFDILQQRLQMGMDGSAPLGMRRAIQIHTLFDQFRANGFSPGRFGRRIEHHAGLFPISSRRVTNPQAISDGLAAARASPVPNPK